MKWIYVILVVPVKMFGEWNLSGPENASEETQTPASSRVFDAASALLRTNSADSYVYYSSLMDGWSKTHEDMMVWLSPTTHQACRTAWNRFVDRDSLLVTSEEELSALKSWMESLLSFPVAYDERMNAYAIRMLCHSINEGCRFAMATRTCLMVAAKVVGVTRDDSEYRSH